MPHPLHALSHAHASTPTMPAGEWHYYDLPALSTNSTNYLYLGPDLTGTQMYFISYRWVVVGSTWVGGPRRFA